MREIEELAQAKEAEEFRTLLYLTSCGADGLPHPLFDAVYYLRNNPDVAMARQDPLAHYMTTGAAQLRNPHALFDAKFYVDQHPEVLATMANPLLHFVTEGARLGYNPNPHFDIEYYLWRNPDVAAAGVNPLVHFVTQGSAKGLDPYPLFSIKDYLRRYPDIAEAGAEPLAHFLAFGKRDYRTASRPLYFSERYRTYGHALAAARARAELQPSAPLPVFCVYGPSHRGFLQEALIPAFANQVTSFPIELHFLNYQSSEALLDLPTAHSGSVSKAIDWSATRPPQRFGFGESVNYLFHAVKPPECFVLCNPDSFPMPGCLTQLMDTYLKHDAAIVEAQQWPSAHPKEFDPATLETPWASGAFDLISAQAFAELGGFDPVYFLYMEDVDLSWRAWLSGRRVLHQPLAQCAHATGMYSYHQSRFYYEHYFSLRNFLVIAYKFWEELGERIAMEYLKLANPPANFLKKILDSYYELRPSINVQPAGGSNVDKVKILGLNVFHEFQ